MARFTVEKWPGTGLGVGGWAWMELTASHVAFIYLSHLVSIIYYFWFNRIENQTKLFSKTSFNERLWEISSFLLCLFHRKGFGGSQLPFALKPVQSTFKAALGRSLDLREKAMIRHDSLVMSWLPWVSLTPLSSIDHENGDSASRDCRRPTAIV